MRVLWLYFVEAQMGMVKCGISFRPEGRAMEISSHSPSPVRLVAKLPANREDERAFQEKFSAYRSHAEWFHLTGSLVDYIDGIRGQGVTIVDWSAVLWSSREERLQRGAAIRAEKHRKLWADPAFREAAIKNQRHWREQRRLKALASAHARPTPSEERAA